MKRMERTVLLAVCGCVLAVSTAWGKASPAEVATEVYEGVRDGNVAQIKANCTEAAGEVFELLAEIAKDMPMSGTTFKVLDTQMDATGAVVTLRATKPGETEPTTEKIHLKEVDGNWKIDDLVK